MQNLMLHLPPILEEEGGTTKTIFTKKQLLKQDWKIFFDQMEIVNGTPIYQNYGNQPIILMIHGAGHCAMTFALLSNELRTFCSCVSYDMISHGLSQRTESLQTINLITECEKVIDYIHQKNPSTTIILLGHSLGAVIASKIKIRDYIRALIVIDMIEKNAIESIPIMEKTIRQRPTQFYSYSSAVTYHLSQQIIKNPLSAQITVPHYLDDTMGWKVDLISTKKYWTEWFNGIQKAFDEFPYAKMLFVAQADRLCSIQFRNSKYPIHLFENSGHNMHEDEPVRMAKHISDFLFQNRIPINEEEITQLHKVGTMNFRPKLTEYVLKNII